MLKMFYYYSFIFYLNFYQFYFIIKIFIKLYNIDIDINNKKTIKY